MTEVRKRAREIGINIGRLEAGPHNAITDVAGVKVGHETIIRGDGQLVVGEGPVRTGVTVVWPHSDGTVAGDPVYAGYHQLNGNGEMTGIAWVQESGLLTSPVGITNTASVGVVRDALIAYDRSRFHYEREPDFHLPVVGETYDGWLSDINGFHVTRDHLFAAADSASGGAVAEGCVGGGTGMNCHEFKGGIGTSSRRIGAENGGWTVGALVQANYGMRHTFRIDGGADRPGDRIRRGSEPAAGADQGRLDHRHPGDGRALASRPVQADRAAGNDRAGQGGRKRQQRQRRSLPGFFDRQSRNDRGPTCPSHLQCGVCTPMR